MTTPAPPIQPVVLPAYSKCNNLTNVVCAAGTACFNFNNVYAECRPTCPSTWACETEVLPIGEQCGGMINCKYQLNFELFYFRRRLHRCHALRTGSQLLCS